MPASTPTTRRTFLQTLTALGAAASLRPYALATPTALRFAFVASPDSSLHVLSLAESGTWTRTQTVSSQAPTALVLSPDQRFLYVANGIAIFNDRPTGSVEAYDIAPQTGSLTLLNRQPLALFSTTPSHLAISRDGRRLAVAAGSAINLLPLEAQGALGRVTACVRPLGPRALGQLRALSFEDDITLVAHHTVVSCFIVGAGGSLVLDDSQSGSRSRSVAASPPAPMSDFGIDRPVALALMSRRNRL